MKIDIEGLNKVLLVKALYDAAIPTDKTDLSREITLEDIAFFVNKDRKINVINGKNIKLDIGREKLSSGAYDKFNGDFAAINAVNQLKSRYQFIPLPFDCSIPAAINILRSNNVLCYGIFNGHALYSDNLDDIDYIYTRISGIGTSIEGIKELHPKRRKRKKLNFEALAEQAKERQRKVIHMQEKDEKEFMKRISIKTKAYTALAHGIIFNNKLEEWSNTVRNKLEFGEELEIKCVIDIAQNLKSQDYRYVCTILDDYRSMAVSMDVRQMLINYVPKGRSFIEFYEGGE